MAAHRHELRHVGQAVPRLADRVLGADRARAPVGQPEAVVFDVVQDAVDRPGQTFAQLLGVAAAPIRPAVADRDARGEERAVVRGEAEAEPALDVVELGLAQPGTHRFPEVFLQVPRLLRGEGAGRLDGSHDPRA